jgi:hypothetical protein
MKIIPSFFNPGNRNTDVLTMIRQEKYSNALFLFNDNTYEYFDKRCSPGGGNGCLRPYKVGCKTHIDDKLKRSWGIPTGPGFDKMTKRIKMIIDYVMKDIRKILEICKFDKIIYSAESKRGKRGRQTEEGYYYLGSGIFHIGDDVKQYITKSIYQLAGNKLEKLDDEDITDFVPTESEEEDEQSDNEEHDTENNEEHENNENNENNKEHENYEEHDTENNEEHENHDTENNKEHEDDEHHDDGHITEEEEDISDLNNEVVHTINSNVVSSLES